MLSSTFYLEFYVTLYALEEYVGELWTVEANEKHIFILGEN